MGDIPEVLLLCVGGRINFSPMENVVYLLFDVQIGHIVKIYNLRMRCRFDRNGKIVSYKIHFTGSHDHIDAHGEILNSLIEKKIFEDVVEITCLENKISEHLLKDEYKDIKYI